MKNPWHEIKTPFKNVVALRVDSKHPLDLFWAMDSIGRYLFVYEYAQNSETVMKSPPELEGIEVALKQIEENKAKLILILVEKIIGNYF